MLVSPAAARCDHLRAGIGAGDQTSQGPGLYTTRDMQEVEEVKEAEDVHNVGHLPATVIGNCTEQKYEC